MSSVMMYSRRSMATNLQLRPGANLRKKNSTGKLYGNPIERNLKQLFLTIDLSKLSYAKVGTSHPLSMNWVNLIGYLFSFWCLVEYSWRSDSIKRKLWGGPGSCKWSSFAPTLLDLRNVAGGLNDGFSDSCKGPQSSGYQYGRCDQSKRC